MRVNITTPRKLTRRTHVFITNVDHHEFGGQLLADVVVTPGAELLFEDDYGRRRCVTVGSMAARRIEFDPDDE